MTLNREALIADIRTLVECESPSSDPAALGRCAEVLARFGTDYLGVVPEMIGYPPILRWRFGGGGVLVVCHYDTVWPLGSLTNQPCRIDGDRLSGPGSFDMKSGLVMAFHALAELRRQGPLDGVSLLITADEEIGSPAGRPVIEAAARQARAVLVLEAPAAGALKVARKAISLYQLTVRGRAAHAGLEPEKGVNATVELAHQILALQALPLPAGASLVPTLVQAGAAINTVPDEARLDIDVRAWTAQDQALIDAAIRGIKPVLAGAQLEIGGGVNRPPLERRHTQELFERAQALVAAAAPGDPLAELAPLEAAEVGGASDGNFCAGMGIPTLDGLGADGDGAHAVGEHCLISSLLPRTRLLMELIRSGMETR